MTPPSSIQKLSRFVRSVWPAQPNQAALLAGSALLLTVFRVGCWHHWTVALARSQGALTGQAFFWIEKLTLAAVYLAGANGLYISFFPKPDPLGRLTRLVFLPVVAGWIANIAVSYYFHQKYPYVTEAALQSSLAYGEWTDSFLSSVGLGFWVSTVALLCILMARWSLQSGEMSLSVTFLGVPAPSQSSRTRKFVWLMVVWCMPLTSLVTAIGVTVVNPAVFRGWGAEHHLGELIIQLLITIPFSGLLLLAMGADAWRTIRASLKFPPITYALLAVAIPFCLGSIPPLFEFAVARVHWASTSYGQSSVPTLREHFPPFQWVYLSMIVAALLEEIAWRGYLQPRLISRYGLYRGIFFVGIIWGAFHFPVDFGSTTHLIDFVLHFAGRLVNCVAWGFVLSWLTLRSKGSVIPAGITHGVMNALYTMEWNGKVSNWVMYTLWAALAFILFRFWPPPETPQDPLTFPTHPDPNPNPDDDIGHSPDAAPSPA
jgi:membrane protease YdiL (CAAX protease family)